MNIKDNFKKGSVEMLVLKLLAEDDLYGYQMTQMIIERGGGYIKIPEGSLYPTLYKLEDKGYISSYEKLVGKRMRRIYYHLEENGRAYLEKLIQEYHAVNQCIIKILNYNQK
ncbi:MAG: PadR family transcriptional regulator [Sellimonas sp.]|uniref:PadR family transcriptional regulator n=1 Tax=Sellimonas sp. TaxID=2021466 RepID=UPI0039A0E3EE